MTTSFSFWRWFGPLVLASVAIAWLPATTDARVTTLVSVHSDGTQGDDWSYHLAVNADGRYLAFYSEATTLVDGDDNGVGDVFFHDRDTGVTTRVSVHSDGSQGDRRSDGPAISFDGRYVAFHSSATTLVDGDDNDVGDIFVHDRDTGVTSLVSVHSDGTPGDGSSASPAFSGDGRYVTFYSYATNLVDGDDNGESDIFVHDRYAEEPPLPGDLDGDGDIDREDVTIVIAGRGEAAEGSDDPRDLDGDGLITVGDARALVLQCTRSKCATE